MKYSTERQGTKATYPNVNQGREPDYSSGSDGQGGMKVDPSVRLGPLKGEPLGCVPLERTMHKPQAYISKKGAP